MDQRALTAEDFARLVGSSPESAGRILERYPTVELRYRELAPDESARVAAEVGEVIANRQLRTVGSDDSRVWDDGWREVAERLRGQPITIDALRPQYFRGEPVCRYEGRYVQAMIAGFEYDVGLVLRRLIFDMYLRDIETIVELGCGTGINLLLMAEQFPRTRFIGCDWAQPSCGILAEMARQSGRSIEGHVFNMLTATGWSGAEIDSRTAVVTVHAMEQLGDGWPALCLHIEPLLELYDADSAFDGLARRYHLKRNYLTGFYPYVMELVRTGKAAPLGARRIRFGGLHHEAYSILAWKPQG
jgi:hypothetical protein